MDLLNDVDWSYPQSDAKSFIKNDKYLENSAMFRIVKGTFTNPVLRYVDKNEEKITHQPQNKNNKNEVNKKKLPKKPVHNMPTSKTLKEYVPGYKHKMPIFPQSSKLTCSQHEICVKVLRSLNVCCVTMPNVKITNDQLQFYNNLIPIINEEQKQFMEYVKNIWNTEKCIRFLKMNHSYEDFIVNIWKQQINSYKKYPRFYEMASMLPLVYFNTEVPIELEYLKPIEINNINQQIIDIPPNQRNLMEFKKPIFEAKLNKYSACSKTRKTVSEDIKCEIYAVDHRADIVISSNGLKTIADNYKPFANTWSLPISVKEYKTTDDKGNYLIHKIAFVDRALPSHKLIEQEKYMRFSKLLVKSNFLEDDSNKIDEESAVSVKKNKVCKSCKDFAIKYSEEKIPKLKVDTIASSSDSDEESLVIDIPMSPSQDVPSTSQKIIATRSSRKSIQKSPRTGQIFENKVCSCDYKIVENFESNGLDLIKKVLELDSNDVQEEKITLPKDIPECNNTYNLWRIGQSKEKMKYCKDISRDITILVRSKIDGYEMNPDGTKQPYVIVPKVEYQSEYGAEIITPSEAVQQWMALKFRPNSKLLRVRFQPSTREVLMVEKIPLQAFTSEVLKRTPWRPEHGLGCYFNIFSKLCHLNPGQYVLRHEPKHHAFSVLYSSTNQSCENGLDLEELYKYPEEFSITQNTPWTPLDPTIVTPNLNQHKVIPCMFTPGECKLDKRVLKVKRNIQTQKRKQPKRKKKNNKNTN